MHKYYLLVCCGKIANTFKNFVVLLYKSVASCIFLDTSTRQYGKPENLSVKNLYSEILYSYYLKSYAYVRNYNI